MQTTTRSYRDADCRYCERYNRACGRHTETVALNDATHVISASIVGSHSLSMCGKDLGPYETARANGHVTGNYATPTSVRETVTCQTCAERMTETFRHYGWAV